MKQEQDLYPSIGVMYPSVLDELEPPVESEVMEGESALSEGLREDIPSCIYLYPAWMDEVDPPVESEVIEVNEPFDTSKVICST